MNQKSPHYYSKDILLYATTITLLIVSAVLYFGKVVFISDKISLTVAAVLLFLSYILIMRIAEKLEKKGIMGLQNIAVSTVMLYPWLGINANLKGIGWSIFQLLAIIVLFFILVVGIIHFSISVVSKIQTVSSSEKDKVDSVDTVVAVATSLIAAMISIITFIKSL